MGYDTSIKGHQRLAAPNLEGAHRSTEFFVMTELLDESSNDFTISGDSNPQFCVVKSQANRKGDK